jgi:Ca2+/Na+ antiporter
MDWRPFIRDSFFFYVATGMILYTLGDRLVSLRDGLLFLSVYGCYILYMVLNSRINARFCPRPGDDLDGDQAFVLEEGAVSGPNGLVVGGRTDGPVAAGDADGGGQLTSAPAAKVMAKKSVSLANEVVLAEYRARRPTRHSMSSTSSSTTTSSSSSSTASIPMHMDQYDEDKPSPLTRPEFLPNHGRPISNRTKPKPEKRHVGAAGRITVMPMRGGEGSSGGSAAANEESSAPQAPQASSASPSPARVIPPVARPFFGGGGDALAAGSSPRASGGILMPASSQPPLSPRARVRAREDRAQSAGTQQDDSGESRVSAMSRVSGVSRASSRLDITANALRKTNSFQKLGRKPSVSDAPRGRPPMAPRQPSVMEDAAGPAAAPLRTRGRFLSQDGQSDFSEVDMGISEAEHPSHLRHQRMMQGMTSEVEAAPALYATPMSEAEQADSRRRNFAALQQGSGSTDHVTVHPPPYEVGEVVPFQDMSLPRKLMYLMSLPFQYLFMWTIPDCDTERYKQGWWFLLAIVISVTYIGTLTYFLVLWVELIGCILGLSSEIMALTLLSAGSSTPDALASAAVAREGHGGMGIAITMGCNVFNVLFGLGLPWTLMTAIYGITLPINSESLTTLLGILVFSSTFAIIVFAAAKWRLSKVTGYFLFALYGIFCIYIVADAMHFV